MRRPLTTTRRAGLDLSISQTGSGGINYQETPAAAHRAGKETAMSQQPQHPGERFNFAAHILSQNAGRAAKPAYIDDTQTLTYGQLDERVRRFAAGLLKLGIRRE